LPMLPAKIRVKLLPEAAGFINVSHVMQRDFTIAELGELLLAVVGADAARFRQILRAGTVVLGDYRYRWESLEVDDADVASLLSDLTHAEPSRTFEPHRALLVRFRRGHVVVEISREAASHKPLFARQSFWDGIVSEFTEVVCYADYSHAEKADVFAAALDEARRQTLESMLSLIKPKSVAERIERLRPEKIEWLIRR
jgi:hypothetical protein